MYNRRKKIHKNKALRQKASVTGQIKMKVRKLNQVCGQRDDFKARKTE